MLFSATKTPKTNELVKVVLREGFIDIDVTSGEELVTADGLNQCKWRTFFFLGTLFSRKLYLKKKN